MKDFVDDISRLEHKLDEIIDLLKKQSDSSSRRSWRGNHTPPSWLGKLQEQVNFISSEVQDLRRRIATESESSAITAQTAKLADSAPTLQTLTVNSTRSQACGGSISTHETEASTAMLSSAFTLNREDLGESLVKNLVNFIHNDHFDGKVFINGLNIDWHEFMMSIDVPATNDYASVQYRPWHGEGIIRLHGTGDTKVDFPNLTSIIERPSEAVVASVLQRIFRSPFKKAVPYYVGRSLAPRASNFSWVDDLLHPGADLLKQNSMQGINEVQWMAGHQFSGSAFHCEDALLRSCNIVLKGWKLWVRIPTKHTVAFERLIDNLFPESIGHHDDQYVRHKSVMISPERLDQEEIEYITECIGPGTMILTNPREYHCVINITDCFALSINFLLPGEVFIPEPFLVCPDCGLFPLSRDLPTIQTVPLMHDAVIHEHEALNSRPKRQLPVRRERSHLLKQRKIAQRAPISRVAATSTLGGPSCKDSDVKMWQSIARREDRFCQLFTSDQITGTDITSLRIALAVRSRGVGVQNFLNIVKAWRHQGRVERDLLAKTASQAGCLAGLVTLISTLKDRGCLDSLLVATGQIKFARSVEYETGKVRLSNADWDHIRDIMGVSAANRPPQEDKNRNRQYAQWRDRGSKLSRFDLGLLCLVPSTRSEPFFIGYTDLKDLSKAQFNSLNQLLQYDGIHSQLMPLGTDMVMSMTSGCELVSYQWEHCNDTTLMDLPEDELRSLLKPVV